MNRGARRGCAVVVGVVTALLGAMTTPASAGDVAQLIEDAAWALPKVRPVEVRLPKVGLTALEEAKYGIDDAAAIALLDDAKTREVNAIDSAASEVGNAAAESSEVKGKAKECVKESFQKAADDYAKADEEGTTYPVFDNAFYLAVYGCLAATFPHASEDDVGVVAEYLTGRVSQPARDAVTAAPTTFANWLAQVGAASAEPAPLTPTATSGDGDGSSFPWWIIVVLGLLGLGGYTVYKSQSGSSH